jgi:hypothetical protein
MKKVIFLMLTLIVLGAASMNAQVTIGSTSNPDPSAVLDLNTGSSSNGYKGLLLPHVPLKSDRDDETIANPAIGLLVYADGTTGLAAGVYVWDGDKWLTGAATTPVTPPEPVPVTGVTLDIHEYTFTALDQSLTLIPTVAPAEAANKYVTWKSDKPLIASVDADGTVTPVDEGNATITVRAVDGGYEDACAILVSLPTTPLGCAGEWLLGYAHKWCRTETIGSRGKKPSCPDSMLPGVLWDMRDDGITPAIWSQYDPTGTGIWFDGYQGEASWWYTVSWTEGGGYPTAGSEWVLMWADDCVSNGGSHYSLCTQ